MALTFIGQGPNASFTAVTSVTVTTPGSLQFHDLLFVAFAFEGVGAASGPWISGTPQAGWSRAGFADPAGTGVGVEVWWALWDSSTLTTFNFFAARSGDAREVNYRCPLGADTQLDVWSGQSHTGDNLVCPDITTLEPDTLVIGVAGSTLASPGFVWPGGYTERTDNTRAGFGTAEIAYADANQAAPGATGTITTTSTASPAGAEGATMTLGFSCEHGGVKLPYLGVGP